MPNNKTVSSSVNKITDTKISVESEFPIDAELEVLLESSATPIPTIGDVVEGRVVRKETNLLLLDLGTLGIGAVYGVEMRDGMGIVSGLKVGDTLKAMITDFENEDGYIELSVRQASYEKAWDDIKEKEESKTSLPTKVIDANKGGLIIEVNGITGFLPVSQLSGDHYPRVDDGDKSKILELLRKLINKEISVRIIDSDQEAEKLIVSEKAAQSEKESALIGKLKKGDVIEGEVSGVVDFGAFIKFLPPNDKEAGNEATKLEGLAHISELAWQLIDNPREILKAGDTVRAKVIGIEDTRISLSLKALQKDPWETVEEKYHIGDTVEGKVDKINPFGAFVYLDRNIHGLAHVSEFRDIYPGKMMEELISPGETYRWKILSIEPKEHRMGLMLLKK